MKAKKRMLRYVCRLWGVKLDYYDVEDQLIEASESSLLFALEQLSGKEVGNFKSSGDFLRCLERDKKSLSLQRLLPETAVAWQGEDLLFKASFLRGEKLDSFCWFLTGEDGEKVPLSVDKIIESTPSCHRLGDKIVERKNLKIPLSANKCGYFELKAESDQRVENCFVIVAPKRQELTQKKWGLFVPWYGLRSEKNLGVGDTGDLVKVMSFLKKVGGEFIGMLPILSHRFVNGEEHFSPYAPSSRFFWNELLVNIDDLLLTGNEKEHYRGQVTEEKSRLWIDYKTVFEIKREAIEKSYSRFIKEPTEEYLSYVKETSYLREFAEHCCDIEEGSGLFLYIQYILEKQLAPLKDFLYLDFPVGVGRGSFDHQFFADLFMDAMNVGAPPDDFFEGGQDWGFPPLHPQRIKSERFTYLRQCFRRHFQFSKVLRIDHVMGLYRVFCVPQGEPASRGVYIRFPFQELLAILLLEARRAQAQVVGEDLGTVPPIVRRYMEKHQILGMWIYEFEFFNEPERALSELKSNKLAAVNTHDMSPFASFWTGEHLDLAKQLDIMGEDRRRETSEQHRAYRMKWKKHLGSNSILSEILKELAQSEASYVVINSEDLWAEKKPQNVPGTFDEYPNWKKRLSLSIEQWTKDREIQVLLNKVNELRKRKMKL